MKLYRCAIIGCGNISKRHTEALSESKAAQLVAVCDVREERAKATAEKYHCDYCTNWHDIISREDIDAVHLCTPHYLHAIMAIEAMKAGKHVFTEKPMAISVADAEEMIRASEQTGKYLGVCFQNRYKPSNRRLLELINSEKYGKIIGARGIVNWHRTPDYYLESDWRGAWKTEGGGVLINQSIHTLDLLHLVMGDPISVNASCGIWSLGDTIEVEDTATALLHYENGNRALFFASNAYAANAGVIVEVICEHATIQAGEDFLIVQPEGGPQTSEYLDGNIKDEKNYWGNCHHIIIDDFYRCIADSRPFPVDGCQGIRTLRTIEMIYKAANFGPAAK